MFLPNLEMDDVQSLRMVMLELSEVMCSPMALSKLKLQVMKERRENSQKEVIKDTNVKIYFNFEILLYNL